MVYKDTALNKVLVEVLFFQSRSVASLPLRSFRTKHWDTCCREQFCISKEMYKMI